MESLLRVSENLANLLGEIREKAGIVMCKNHLLPWFHKRSAFHGTLGPFFFNDKQIIFVES